MCKHVLKLIISLHTKDNIIAKLVIICTGYDVGIMMRAVTSAVSSRNVQATFWTVIVDYMEGVFTRNL